MLQLIVLGALAFAVLIAIFAVQNTTPVAVLFLTVRIESVAVSVLVIVSAGLGAAVMLLLGAAREVRTQLERRTLRNRLVAAEGRARQLEGAAGSAPTEVAPLEHGPLEPGPESR